MKVKKGSFVYTVGTGTVFRERVAQAGHFMLCSQRGLPAWLGTIHCQLVEAVGLQDLCGGVGAGVVSSAWATVARLAGEVDAAVDGTIRQHGARLFTSTSRQHV